MDDLQHLGTVGRWANAARTTGQTASPSASAANHARRAPPMRDRLALSHEFGTREWYPRRFGPSPEALQKRESR